MTRYSPGDWYGVVTPAGVALLPRAVPMSAVERVWMDLRAGGGLGALIDGLVGAFGTSLSRLPEFGVVALSPDGEVRVAMRGEVSARLWLIGETVPTLVNGTGVTTWNERLWTGVGRAELMVGRSGVDDSDGPLPVVDGVLWARSLHVAILDFDTQPPLDRMDDPAADENIGDDSRPIEPTPDPEPAVADSSAAEEDGARAVPPEPEPEWEPEPAAVESEQAGPDGTSETVLPELAPAEDVSESVSEPRSAAAPGQTTVIELIPEDQPQSDYDQLLFGETMMASAESAAVRVPADEAVDQQEFDQPAPSRPGPPPPPLPPVPPPLPAGLIAGVPSFGAPPPPPPPPTPAVVPAPAAPAPWADHDGETVMVDDLRALLAARQGPALPAPQHPRMLLAGQPPIALDRSAIVGSRPRFTRVQGGSVPQLVTVHSPNGEISRSHVEIRVEHANVLAVDLNSTNGTVLLRAGADPMRLHPGEAYMLVPGDQVDLGDGVTLAFEGLT